MSDPIDRIRISYSRKEGRPKHVFTLFKLGAGEIVEAKVIKASMPQQEEIVIYGIEAVFGKHALMGLPTLSADVTNRKQLAKISCQ